MAQVAKERGAERPFPIEDILRDMMVRHVDRLWQEHLLGMDHLRTDVSLRTVGQRDPLLEFKHEAFNLFENFNFRLSEEIAHALFAFHVMVRPESFSTPMPNVIKFEHNPVLE
jgi:Preprotein translocase subunit SecA (ATPase, RNA helicase)